MPLQLAAYWALVTSIAITVYVVQRDPAPLSASRVLIAVGWSAIPLGILAATGAILHVLAERRERRAAQALQVQQVAVEIAHPGTRVTPLSSGRWLLTDLATGKTVGEVDAPA